MVGVEYVSIAQTLELKEMFEFPQKAAGCPIHAPG